jgi:hypothetical protein
MLDKILNEQSEKLINELEVDQNKIVGVVPVGFTTTNRQFKEILIHESFGHSFSREFEDFTKQQIIDVLTDFELINIIKEYHNNTIYDKNNYEKSLRNAANNRINKILNTYCSPLSEYHRLSEIKVHQVEIGRTFYIREYDGAEDIVYVDEDKYSFTL